MAEAEVATETIARPDADDVRAWIGYRVDEISGGNVGRVEGVFVDESGGAPEWLVARMGRFGHYTLIPGRDAVEGVGHVWVPYSRDQIRKAPRIDPNAPLTAAAEHELLTHYGIAVDAGRAAELEQLGDSAVSARPA
jgi:hypothetical protein